LAITAGHESRGTRETSKVSLSQLHLRTLHHVALLEKAGVADVDNRLLLFHVMNQCEELAVLMIGKDAMLPKFFEVQSGLNFLHIF
jgi:hypothetical protein